LAAEYNLLVAAFGEQLRGETVRERFVWRSKRDLPAGQLLIPFHVGVIHLHFVFRVPVDRGLHFQEVEESFYFSRVQTLTISARFLRAFSASLRRTFDPCS
jgi:hypothetical protein